MKTKSRIFRMFKIRSKKSRESMSSDASRESARRRLQFSTLTPNRLAAVETSG
jgi:hypothetical protein